MCQGLQAYPRLILDCGREQRDGVFFRDASLDRFLAQPLQPRFSVKGGQVEQPCTHKNKHTRDSVQDLLQHFLCCWQPWATSDFTNSVLWWQVYSVSVEILQEGSVHQVWELMNFYGVLVCFIQQCTEVLTPGGERKEFFFLTELTCSHTSSCGCKTTVSGCQKIALPKERKRKKQHHSIIFMLNWKKRLQFPLIINMQHPGSMSGCWIYITWKLFRAC